MLACIVFSPTVSLMNLWKPTLKKRFSEDEDAVKIIERETHLVNKWIAETEPPEPKVTPRTLGTVEPFEKKHGSRSIFDDIDDGDA